MLFGLIKYKAEPRFHVISNSTAVFYGEFLLSRQDECLISLKSDLGSYTVFGSGLSIAAITKPKTVIKGKIERVDII